MEEDDPVPLILVRTNVDIDLSPRHFSGQHSAVVAGRWIT